MCTLTVHKTTQKIMVTMNRDEQRSRDQEIEPYLWNSFDIFAPKDSKRNGTWIGVNKSGKIAALLNGYQYQDSKEDYRTRGDIIPLILSGEHIDPSEYASFHLVEISFDGIKHASWDGTNFVEQSLTDTEWNFFTSSSWKQELVKAYRKDYFDQWFKQGALLNDNLPSIHVQSNEGFENMSVLMSRDNACTKSITQFEVSHDDIISRYWPEPHQGQGDYKMYQPFCC